MSGLLTGRRVVVTAGGTREPIDPVRYIGNHSSGKMGNALAAAAAEAGARVLLITAAADIPEIPGVDVVAVNTASEMRKAVWFAMDSADVLFMAAAVADYRPREAAPRKLKKSEAGLTLNLVPTADILRDLLGHPRHAQAFIVGFAAETDDLEANARAKLESKSLDLVILNNIASPGIGMGADDNAVTVIDRSGVLEIVARAPKIDIARRLVALVIARLPPLG